MCAHVNRPLSRLGMLALIALLGAAGCAGDTSSSASTASINNIEVGMTESQVLSTLGQPQKREAYGGTSFLFYTDASGTTVPVAIVGGRVTSIGRAAYDIVVRSQAQQQPTGSVHRK
jgi:outer membrane protein assembly factor BamE (lipoprotein component of BamABCDE complex)